MKNLASLAVFNTIDDVVDSGLLFGVTL